MRRCGEETPALAPNGLRDYRVAGESGTHTGHLWRASGTLLGTVTFAGESSTGWQTASFATPIAIQANTTYVASVNSNVAWGATDLTTHVFSNQVPAPQGPC